MKTNNSKEIVTHRLRTAGLWCSSVWLHSDQRPRTEQGLCLCSSGVKATAVFPLVLTDVLHFKYYMQALQHRYAK